MGIRTDLALEEQEQLSDVAEGVSYRTWETHQIRMTEIHIESDTAAEALHKPVGTYRTMEMSEEQLRSERETCAEVLTDNLIEMIPKSASVLVVGLGNRGVTPDAIGPNVLRRVLVTRHLASAMPELAGILRQVCSIAPGVLGETGLESAEIVQGIVSQVQPECAIVIDALASARPERLCRSIQISDAGIIPGSGVGNNRKALNRETLGIPVFAIGVPTVCDLRSLMQTEKQMIVTSGKIDAEIEGISRIIASAVNQALQQTVSKEDLAEIVGEL